MRPLNGTLITENAILKLTNGSFMKNATDKKALSLIFLRET